MDTSICPCDTPYNVSNEINWVEQYPLLQSLARRLVYKYRILCWYGQEQDVAEDVAQETARRLIERLQKAARGEATPLDSPERMMVILTRSVVSLLSRSYNAGSFSRRPAKPCPFENVFINESPAIAMLTMCVYSVSSRNSFPTVPFLSLSAITSESADVMTETKRL